MALDQLAERTEVTARAIITIGGYLLVCQGVDDPFCHLPGGHVEAGEEPGNALRRELQEELGRPASSVQYLATIENVFDKGNTRIREQMWLYKATLSPQLQEVPPRSAEDWLTFQWVPLYDLAKERLLPPAVHQYAVMVGGQ